MAGIAGISQLTPSDLYTSSATPGENLQIGQLFWDGKSGKAFRYALNGGVALVKGNVLQEAAEDTSYENMVVAAAAPAGQTYLQITNGTATITSAAFVGGSLSIYTAGTITICDEYTIKGITGTLTTGGALKVYLDRPLRAAVTTSATVNMKMSPWSQVIAAPVTCTGMLVGVAHYEIPADKYGWVQTHGPCAVVSDNGTFAVGSDIGSPITVTGSAGVFAAGTAQMRIGVTRMAKANGAGLAAFLQID